MIHFVKVPRLNPNEDEALVADITVSVGDKVETGDELFVLETAKATVSIEAEVTGYIRRLFIKYGEMVKVEHTACIIADTVDETLPELTLEAGEEISQKIPKHVKKITAKDRIKSRRRFRLDGGMKVASHVKAESLQIEVVPSQNLPWVKRARTILESLSLTDESLETKYLKEFLPTDGAAEFDGIFIGTGAQLGKNSVIRAKRLYVAPNVKIGDNTYIEAESLYLGKHTKIGRNTNIVTVEFIVEEGAYIGDWVEIDLSGGRLPDSRLLIGPACLVSPRSFINTSREVVMEKESALSPGTMIFTHSFWQSVLEGYFVAFAGVRLCENSWIGGGSQIMPGTIVGKGSVVMSNSTVIDNVPPYSLVGGVPSSVLRRNIKRVPDYERKIQIVRNILHEFKEVLRFKNCRIEDTSQEDVYLITLPDGMSRTLMFLPKRTSDAQTIVRRSIVLTFGQELPPIEQGSVFDLTNNLFTGAENRLTHELRNFFRRRGIRFKPYAWDASFKHGL